MTKSQLNNLLPGMWILHTSSKSVYKVLKVDKNMYPHDGIFVKVWIETFDKNNKISILVPNPRSFKIVNINEELFRLLYA